MKTGQEKHGGNGMGGTISLRNKHTKLLQKASESQTHQFIGDRTVRQVQNKEKKSM